MSSSPRSVVIARHESATAGEYSTLVTCPANHTLLIKSAAVLNKNAAAATFMLYLSSPGKVQEVDLIRTSLPTATTNLWSGWVVLDPNDTLSMFASVANVAIWVSGTVFDGVGVIPPAAQTKPGIPGFMPLTNS